MRLILLITLVFSSMYLYSNEVNKISNGENNTSSSLSKKESIKIPIIYISNFEGRFINIDKEQETTYNNLLGKIKYYQNILPILNKWERPITLNNGSSFWRSISVKYLLEQPKGIKLISDLLKENHFDVINIGKKDMYTPYKMMSKLSESKDILSLPFLSSNMVCKAKSKAPICKLIKKRKYKIINVSNVKIAIISTISHKVISKAFYKSIDGVTILKEDEESNRIAKYLKKEKNVDIVILLAQIDSEETSPQKTIKFSQRLKNIDLIISNSEDTKLIRKYNDDTYIVGANPNRYSPSLLLLELSKKDDKYKLKKIENYYDGTNHEANVSDIFKNILENYKKDYFKKYDIPINNMKIKGISFKDFYTFILRLMIKKTDSEIGIINKKNFNDKFFPINKLTYDTIEKSLVYNNKIASFEISGKLLESFLKKYKDSLLFANIKFGKTIKINGRTIIGKKLYKVVTTSFIVNGGDNYFKDEFFVKEKKYYSKIKDIFVKYLEQEKFIKNNLEFNPYLEFEDLSKRFLWEFYSSLGVYYMKNDVSNPESYDKERFASIPTELLKIDGVLSLLTSSNYHKFENRLELHYYQSKENNTEFQESSDLVTYSFNYKNNYFKLVNNDNLFVPLPYIEGKLNTELTKPNTEDKHFYELIVSAGASFLSLKDKLEFKLGLQGLKNFKTDKNIEYGMVIGYKLDNYELKTLDIPINITSKLEYFRGFENFDTIDFSLVVNIPILGFFHFSTKLENFLYKEANNDWGYYYNVFLGVNFIYNQWF